MIIDGEEVSDKEVFDVIRMMDHDCKEFAGQFFEEDRSKKFRKSWNEVGKLSKRSPQDAFVAHAWKHFVVHVRAWYASRLADPNEPEAMKVTLHRALIIQANWSQSAQAKDVLQLAPGTQQFAGDKFENKAIAETYGTEAESVRKTLLGTSALH
jgi:hypothetical protein